jgi:hypothetical protein
MRRQRFCKHCQKQTDQEVVCKLIPSGMEMFSWYCHNCQRLTPQKNGGQWISREALVNFGVDIESLHDFDWVKEQEQKQMSLEL